MTTLKIVALVVAKPEHQESILKALKAVTEGTRKEPGNISYDLHQDVNDPLKYVLIEVWKSDEAIREHQQAPHYITFKEDIAGKTDSLEIHTIREIYQ